MNQFVEINHPYPGDFVVIERGQKYFLNGRRLKIEEIINDNIYGDVAVVSDRGTTFYFHIDGPRVGYRFQMQLKTGRKLDTSD